MLHMKLKECPYCVYLLPLLRRMGRADTSHHEYIFFSNSRRGQWHLDWCGQRTSISSLYSFKIKLLWEAATDFFGFKGSPPPRSCWCLHWSSRSKSGVGTKGLRWREELVENRMCYKDGKYTEWWREERPHMLLVCDPLIPFNHACFT